MVNPLDKVLGVPLGERMRPRLYMVIYVLDDAGARGTHKEIFDIAAENKSDSFQRNPMLQMLTSGKSRCSDQQTRLQSF